MIMYKQFFGFSRNPFGKDIDSPDLMHHDVFASFTEKIEFLKTHGGIGLLWGAAGTGKSAGLRWLRDSLNRNRYRFYYVSYPPSGLGDFYRELALCMDLRPAFRRTELFRQIQDHIADLAATKKITPIIALDEAQSYHHTVLESLRMFLNFNIDSMNHALLILAGQPDLRKKLKFSVYEPLTQRITVQHQFLGLDQETVEKYILHRLGIAGVKHQIFEPEAVHFMHKATDGNMRKINNLALVCLETAARKKNKSVDRDTVDMASRDLFWT